MELWDPYKWLKENGSLGLLRPYKWSYYYGTLLITGFCSHFVDLQQNIIYIYMGQIPNMGHLGSRYITHLNPVHLNHSRRRNPEKVLITVFWSRQI